MDSNEALRVGIVGAEAGSLFAVDLGVRGQPVLPFAG